MSEAAQSSGSIETRQQETQDSVGQENPAAVWKLWNQSIELATKEEKDWRERATKAINTYTMDGKEEERSKFNILYSNTETIVPAVYNSPPIPDVRTRYNDDGGLTPEGMQWAEDSKKVAQVLERCISFAVDTSEFDAVMKASVFDAALPGRGVARIQYMPIMGADGMMAYQKLYLQHVQWDDYRHGPAKNWEGVPWVAYRHRMTRQQLVQLNPTIGPLVKLDCNVEGYDPEKSEFPPDLFKRAEVWEIWDKEAREVVFIATGYKDSYLAKMKPPCELEGFFPQPKPLQNIFRTDSLVPIEPYRLYKSQADELESMTRRIAKLIKVLRWRGVRAKALGDAFDKIKDLDDGQLAPAENAMEVLQGTQGIDKFIWMMPIDKLIVVIKELVEQRERIKQVIFEITGIADIMRGSTNASETLGAQQIKTQWGTLRIQDMQKAAQVYSRDIFRIMSEIISEKFTPEVIFMMTGIKLTPQQIQLMQNDVLRQYRIDVETDSTIRADLTMAQKNISEFIQGLAQYVSAVGPLVQQGAMPPEVAIEMMVSFARTFKLGRQVEDVLDQWKQKIMAMSAAGVPAPGTTPPGAQPDPMKERELQLKEKEITMAHERETRKLDSEEQKYKDERSATTLPAREEVMMQNETKMSELGQGVAMLTQLMQQVLAGQQMLLQAQMAPIQVQRDARGLLTGAQKVLPQQQVH